MQNRFINLVKCIACIMVIWIHVRFPGDFGVYVSALARFAVPFFFAVSGRFLMKEQQSEGSAVVSRPLVSKRIKKSMKLFLGSLFVYTLYSFLYYHAVGYTTENWIRDKYNLFGLKVFLLFQSGTFLYDFTYTFDHLWFVLALVYDYMFIWLFSTRIRKHSGVIALLLLGLLEIGQLLRLIHPGSLLGFSVSTWYVLRNWLLVGLTFMLMGLWFYDFRVTTTGQRLIQKEKLWLLLLLAGIVETICSVYLLGEKAAQIEVYLGSICMVVAILFLSENEHVQNWSSSAALLRGMTFVGRYLSGSIYIWHVLVISLLGVLTVGLGGPLWESCKALIVPVLMLLISYVFYLYKKGVKK